MHVACHSLIHHRFSLLYGVCGCMPVSLHYALSPMQFPVVVPVHWTPSAHPPYGSVLACAVPAVFYTPDSGSYRGYPQLPVAWILRLASFPQFLSIRYPPLVQSLPVCLRCLPDSMVPACIAPLRPSAIQVSIVVPLCWPPSAPQPSGFVLAFAVLAVFCAPDSEE